MYCLIFTLARMKFTPVQSDYPCYLKWDLSGELFTGVNFTLKQNSADVKSHSQV